MYIHPFLTLHLMDKKLLRLQGTKPSVLEELCDLVHVVGWGLNCYCPSYTHQVNNLQNSDGLHVFSPMHLMFISMPWTAACHSVVTCSVHNAVDGCLISKGYRFPKDKRYYCHTYWFTCYSSGLKTNLDVQLFTPHLGQKIHQDSAF